MRLSGRFQPLWNLIYSNAGDDVTGTVASSSYPVGDSRRIEYLSWTTDGSSITCYAQNLPPTWSSDYLVGGLVVDSERSFPQATRIKFDVRPSNTYPSSLGVGWGPGPDVWSQRDAGFAVVAGYAQDVNGQSVGVVRIDDYYRHDTVNPFEISLPLGPPYPILPTRWFTVRAIIFGRFVTVKVTGATMAAPIVAMGGTDSQMVADRLRLHAGQAMATLQTEAYATRIKNISVWTMDVLGGLPV